MKKSHGPAFFRRQVPLAECPTCHGAGFIKGLFHQLECIGCHSSGFVDGVSLEPLSLEELAVQLGLRLRSSRAEVHAWERSSVREGAAVQYAQNNRRGAGGTNYTGD